MKPQQNRSSNFKGKILCANTGRGMSFADKVVVIQKMCDSETTVVVAVDDERETLRNKLNSCIVSVQRKESPENGIFVGLKGKGRLVIPILQKRGPSGKNILVIGTPGSGKVKSYIRPIDEERKE